MNEKEFNNVFKLSLFQKNILFCERAFDADQFNPFTRYSIDIRNILPKSISCLQKMLSKKSYDVDLDVGNDKSIDLYGYYENIVKEKYDNDIEYNPISVTQYIKDANLTIRGVEFKLGFYINDNPIVEREFFVDGFNPISRWSVDLLDAFIPISYEIENNIKTSDVKNIWDDYDMINILRLNFNQIREFSPEMRANMLKKLERIGR